MLLRNAVEGQFGCIFMFPNSTHFDYTRLMARSAQRGEDRYKQKQTATVRRMQAKVTVS